MVRLATRTVPIHRGRLVSPPYGRALHDLLEVGRRSWVALFRALALSLRLTVPFVRSLTGKAGAGGARKKKKGADKVSYATRLDQILAWCCPEHKYKGDDSDREFSLELRGCASPNCAARTLRVTPFVRARALVTAPPARRAGHHVSVCSLPIHGPCCLLRQKRPLFFCLDAVGADHVR